jgi:hypothetical protein
MPQEGEWLKRNRQKMVVSSHYFEFCTLLQNQNNDSYSDLFFSSCKTTVSKHWFDFVLHYKIKPR